MYKKAPKLKNLGFQEKKRKNKENECFYQNVQCVIVKESRFIKEQKAGGLLSKHL